MANETVMQDSDILDAREKTVIIVGVKEPLEVGREYEESESVANACIAKGVAKLKDAKK